MADSYDLAALTEGVPSWNRRRRSRTTRPDLSEADLSQADLSGADLSGANLSRAMLNGADLSGADLYKADLSGADLSDANLSRAMLYGADLSGADLSWANLCEANINWANLSRASLASAVLAGASLSGAEFWQAGLVLANLTGAVLSGARLTDADFTGADLTGADLTGASRSGADLDRAKLVEADLTRAHLYLANLSEADLSRAILCGALLSGARLYKADLSDARLGGAILDGTYVSLADFTGAGGLADLEHRGPSALDPATVLSNPALPAAFLRGCGWPERLIEYWPSVSGAGIDFYSGFISYSHADMAFARRLHDQLQGRGIRVWRDEHEILPGDPVMHEIDRGIMLWDKTLLCCTERSLSSWWVEREIEKALEKERRLLRERGERVLALIPLDLDGYLRDGWDNPYKTHLTERLAADFRGWESDNATFEAQFEKVVRAMMTEGGKSPPPEPRL